MSKFVDNTLEYGQGEQRARFGEMSETERAEFARKLLALYEEAGLACEDMERAIPGITQYIFPYVTPVEAAELSGEAESTWRNRCARGEVLGAVKRGKQWLIPRSQVSGE